MITRHYVACPGCDSIIMLRLSVGFGTEQPFYFVCDKCKAATRGKLVIWYEPSPGYRLELQEGKVLGKQTAVAQSVNIHPSFPSVPDAGEMWEQGGSPFLAQANLLGERFIEVNSRLNAFCQLKEADWGKLRRLMGYYIDRDWTHFDDQGHRIFEERWPSTMVDWTRHDVMHTVLDTFLLPLCVNDYYLTMKAEWSSLSLFKAPPKSFLEYIRDCIGSGTLQNDQRNLFHCLEQFVENSQGLLPGVSVLLYNRERESTQLRLFRDDFPQLRDLYVAVFETCHHLLRYPLATVNMQERKSIDDFGGNRKRSLHAFDKLKSVEKAEYLDCLPVWQANWPIVFERRLRNAISHQGIHHDLPSGDLLLPEDRIPYPEFVAKCVLLLHPILALANVLKTMLIMDCLEGAQDSTSVL